jgi:repressor LexA
MEAGEHREILARIALERGVSLSRLSRLIGRNPAYVQQHVMRGSPRRLDEQDRGIIADYLGIDPALLGGPPRALPVSRYDIAASAGPGGMVEIEVPTTPVAFPPDLLASLGVKPSAASIIRVSGDSMVPTLMPGDEILVDAARARPVRGGGVYVLRLDDTLMVKRVRPVGDLLAITSDNADAVSPGTLIAERVTLIGRVVWVGRRL